MDFMKATSLSSSQALVLGTALLLAGLVGSAAAQAPVFLPNQMTAVAGWAGSSTSTTYYGSLLTSCATTTYLSGICTTQNPAFSQFSSEYYDSTFNGDKLPALQTQLYSPGGLATDPQGNLFWIDATLGLIRELNISTGIVSVIAGNITGQTQCTTASGGPAYTSASGACREFNSSMGDTLPAAGGSTIVFGGTTQAYGGASVNVYTLPYLGLSVDSWDNVIWVDGTYHVRVVLGNPTNAANQVNPLIAYIKSLYFGTYSTTVANTVALKATYLSEATTGAQSAPIQGYTYVLAGYYTGVLNNLTGHFGAEPGTTNDNQAITVTGTIAGTQYSSGSAVVGQFPFLAEFDAMSAATQDSSGNVYVTDETSGLVRVLNVQPTPITVAGTTIPAFSLGTIMGNTGSNCNFVVPGTNLNTSGCAGVTTASSNGTSAYSQITATTIAPLGTPTQVPLQKLTSIYVDAPGNIYIGQGTDANAKTDAMLVIYAGASNAVTGAANPLKNILTILYGASNVSQNQVYMLAGNGTNSRSSTDQWGPAANGYSNTTITPGFSLGIFGIAVDSTGNIYFGDGNHAFYRIDQASARIASIAGSLLTTAGYVPPAGVAPYPNYTYASPTAPVACSSIYQQNSVTETNTLEFAVSPFGDGCSTFAAFLAEPTGAAVNANGDAFIADTRVNVIHELLIGNTFGSAINPLTTATTQYVHLHYYGTDLPYTTASGPAIGTGAFTVSGTGFSAGAFVCRLNNVAVDTTSSYDCYAGITYNPAVGTSTGVFYAEAADGAFASVPLTGYSVVPGLLPSSTSINTSLSIVPAQSTVVNITVAGNGVTTPTGTVTLTDTPTGGATVTLLNNVTLTNATASYSGYLYQGTDRLVATYAGDLVYDGSASAPANVTVASESSITALTTSASVVIPGKPVTLTATVSANSGTPTGSVTFYATPSGGSQIMIGTGTVNSSGVATYAWTTPLTPLGAYSIVATYGGQTSNYSPSTSSPTTVTLVYLVSTTSLSASVTTGVPLTPVTLTATVAGVAGTSPTGGVSFYVTAAGGTQMLIGNGNVNPTTGVATYPWALPATPGSYSVVAIYNGDTNYSSSSSSSIAFTDAYLPSTTSLALSAPSGAPASTITLTAAVAGVAGTNPTKTVSFYYTLASGPATLISTVNVAASGTANATATYIWTLPATIGSYTVTATYNGDGNFSPSNSTGQLENVTNLVASQTVLAPIASPVIVGNSIPLSATVSASATTSKTPIGSVNFNDGTTTVVMNSPLNSSDVATGSTTLAVGLHSITAIYSGDTNFVTSTSVPVSVTVSAATTNLTVTSSNTTPAFGQPITLTATVVASGTPLVAGGTVTFTYGSKILGSGTLNGAGVATATTSATALPVGTDSITATYAATTNFLTSFNSTSVTVSALATSVAVTATPATSSYGQSVSIAATVMATGSTQIPSGTVNFTSGGQTLGSAMLNGSGTATISTAALQGGMDTITATYLGVSSYLTSAGTASETVNPLPTSVVVVASPTSTTYGQPVTLMSTVTATGSTVVPSGTVTFTSGALTLGSSPLVAGIAALTTPLLPAGMDAITATFVANNDFTASTSTSAGVTVVSTGTTMVLTASNLLPPVGTSIVLSVKVTDSGSQIPAGTVTFASGGTTLGSGVLDVTGSLSITTTTLPVGADIVTATYAGTTNFVAATASVTVNVTDFSFIETTQIINVLQGGTGSNPLTFSAINGFVGTINITCSTTTAATCIALPGNCTSTATAACNVLTNQVTLPASGVGNTATVLIMAPAKASNSGFPLTRMIAPIQLALLLFFFRRKKKRLASIALLLLSITGLQALTGCGGSTTPQNTSTVTITATSGGDSHSQTVQFIVL
jgi:hypothetical protein